MDRISLIKETTFEVVIPKPEEAGITYDQPINFELLPFAYRNDKYISIGTAFALPDGVMATAAHVLDLHEQQLYGIPVLRDANGKVHEIDQIIKYSYQRDLVVFTLKEYRPAKYLSPTGTAHVNDTVFAVGNALGEGIVIRDGTYTSDTPEDRDGKWSWMRFSAAASPGNSGGPLLDKNGNVLGIVVAKSPNENLNYALPINEVIQAPANLAAFNMRSVYKLPNMDFTATDILDYKVDLPLPAGKLKDKLVPTLTKYYDGMLVSLLAGHHDEIFPQGASSRKLLFSPPVKGVVVIVKSSNGEWVPIPPMQQQKVDLPANGYLVTGQLGDSYGLMRMRKPDDIDLQELIADSRKFMDTLLKVMPLKRETGYETRRVTSLGKAQESRSFNDRYGRSWHVQSWNVPFLYKKMLIYSSPTPEGCVILIAMPPAEKAREYDIDMKVLVDFIQFPYSGSIAEWRTFLSAPKLVADPLRKLTVDYDKNSTVKISAGDFALVCGAECMSISEKSLLNIGFAFDGANDSVNLRIASVQLLESVAGDSAMKLMKVIHPPEDLGEEFGKMWQDVFRGRTPVDGEPIYDQGNTFIMRGLLRAGDADKARAADEKSRFVVSYALKGNPDKADFKRKFDAIMKRVEGYPSVP